MSFYAVDSVTFSYTGRNDLFKAISFSLEENECIGIVGANGSGKTTLAKLMMGILKPHNGDIYLEGGNTQDISLSEIGSKVGYVFQNPDKQLFCPTVQEQMEFSSKYGGANCADRADYYLELFDLAKLKSSSTLELSRGEKQRLALASVMSRNVRFVIMDEPTTGLDILRKQQLENCLLSLREEGKGYMLISHESGFMSRHTDRVMGLKPEGVEYLR